MPNRGNFIGGQDNLYVPDAPTVGTATAGVEQVSVAFTAPSDVGNDDITAYGASATDGTNVIGATGSSSPVTVTGLTNGTSYTARVWAINDYGNGPLSAATASFSPAAPLGIWSGGDADSLSNVIDYVVIASTGTAQDFGDQTRASAQGSSVSSSTRGVIYIGGDTAIDRTDEIDKITIASTGNATDFGNISHNRSATAGASNDTRGLFMGGTDGSADETVDYVTIASDGNASNFGDLSQARSGPANGTSSSLTRAVCAGGYPSSGLSNVIDYRAIASTGNFSDFGDLTVSGGLFASCSSATRIVFAGINEGDTMCFITTASTGNASDFGDLLAADVMGKTGVSSKTIGLIGGGSGINNIDKITIASAANATDFGDLTLARRFCNGGVSNTHGGLA